MRYPLKSVLKSELLFALPLLGILIYGVLRVLHFPLHDFTNYYFGATLFSQGLFGADTYLPCHFNEQIEALGYWGLYANFNPNSPFIVLFFYPLTAFEPLAAKVIFVLLSSLFFAVSLYRLMRLLNVPNYYYLVLAIVLFIPIKNNILFGQVYLLISALMIEGYLWYEKKNNYAAAALWSLAIALKLFPALILLLLLVKRDFKTGALLFLFTGLLFAVSFWSVGMETSLYFLFEVLPKASKGRLSEAFVVNYQSFGMWIKYLFLEDSFYNPKPPVNLGMSAVRVLSALFSVLVLVFTFQAFRKLNFRKGFAILLLAMLLFTPYGNTYSLIFIGIVLLLLHNQWSKKMTYFGLGIGFLICWVDYHSLDGFAAYWQFPRLWALLTLFVATIVYFKQWKLDHRSLVFASVVFILKLDTEEYNQNHLAISPAGLVCQFEQEQDSLLLHGLNRKGDAFWKEKLNDGMGVLMLSDQNRGIGYNTVIWKLEDQVEP